MATYKKRPPIPVPHNDYFRAADILREEAAEQLDERDIMAFLIIASYGRAGVTHGELVNRWGYSTAAASRATSKLGAEFKSASTGKYEAGLRWIEATPDPTNHKYKQLALTDAGRRIYQRLKGG